MNRVWFWSWGWVYRPVAGQGWALLAFTLILCLQVFFAVDRHSHSASDTLYGAFPYAVLAFGILGWVASRTSQRP